MQTSNRRLRCILAALIFTFSFSVVALAQSPKVTKVEPPNWWAGLPEDPMLLMYGEDLHGARLSVSYPGVSIAKVQPGNQGYLFVWLNIAPGAKPGTAKITVTNASGKTVIDFPLLQRKPAAGRYRGITKDDVLYLIMPDRFADGDPSNDDPPLSAGEYDRSDPRKYHGGDLQGVQQHLPYLKDLGVTALWLTPFWQNDDHVADYHGYHVTDFYGVEEHFGTLKGYQELVAATHAQGMKFFFDYVVNHIGPDHVWAQHPPTNTWLHGTVAKHRPFSYQFQYLVDPHAPPAEWLDIVEGWFPTRVPTGLPDMNVDDPMVAKYLLDNAIWWMELGGIDGFRLDTFPYSSRKFWSKWHTDLFRIYPTTNTIGEVWNFDPTITAFFEGGRKQWDGIDTHLPTMFDFPVFNTIRDVLVRNAPASKLPEVMRYDQQYLRPDLLVTFIGNHDTMRFMGENGATPEALRSAFALLATLRGIPSIYAGDEIAMTGGSDPDNRRDFPGGWPTDATNAFTNRTPQQAVVFNYLRDLLRLRKEHPALREGRQTTITAGDNQFAFVRESGSDRLLVVFSKVGGLVKFPAADTPIFNARQLTPLLASPQATIASGEISLEVPHEGVFIYIVR